MSKRKGLSADEKKNRMLELFYEKKGVFNYKELEKAAQAEKGIVSQSVKEIVQSLIADGYVDTDKIGISIYYWAFPSKALSTRQDRLSSLRTKKEEKEAMIQQGKDHLMHKMLNLRDFLCLLFGRMQHNSLPLLKLREDTPERKHLLDEFEAIKKETEYLSAELAKYAESDPEVIIAEQGKIKEAVEGVNRWTENLEKLRAWGALQFRISRSEFSNCTGIPEDLEEVSVEPSSHL